jgi:hypothetical protein
VSTPVDSGIRRPMGHTLFVSVAKSTVYAKCVDNGVSKDQNEGVLGRSNLSLTNRVCQISTHSASCLLVARMICIHGDSCAK